MTKTHCKTPLTDLLQNSNRPCVMGVVNCSANSFYQPVPHLSAGIDLASEMVAAGVDIIDIGGEATNPSVNVERDGPSIEQEIERVIPLITAIKQRFNVNVSVDTSQAKVMQAAIEQDVDFINDQRALNEPGALAVVANADIPVCLMHFFSSPRKPGSCSKAALLLMIQEDLNQSIARCLQAGISKNNIIIDPGFGQGNYGKNSQENYYLLAHLKEFVMMGYPVLAGWSRKSMIGDVIGNAPASERLAGSIAAATLAAMQGASIIRVHDVKATVDAMKIFQAMHCQEK